MARLGDKELCYSLSHVLVKATHHIKAQELSLVELKELIVTLLILRTISNKALQDLDTEIDPVYIHKTKSYLDKNLTVSYEEKRPKKLGGSAYFDFYFSGVRLA